MKLNKDILLNFGDHRVRAHITKLEFLDDAITGEAEYDTLAGLIINEDRENAALVFDSLEHEYEDAQNRQVTVSYDKATGRRIETLKGENGEDVVLQDAAPNRPTGLADELASGNPASSFAGKAEGSTKDARASDDPPSKQVPVKENAAPPPDGEKTGATKGGKKDYRNNNEELRDQDKQEETFRNDPSIPKDDPKNPKGAPQSLGEAAKKV